jgi:hypothetical protein
LPVPPRDTPADGPAEAPSLQWREVLSLERNGWTTLPAEFRPRSGELRLILDGGPTSNEVLSGVLVVNVLPGGSSVPIVTARIERQPEDSVAVDTLRFSVDPGPLALFVAQQHGLSRWRISVQEGY